LSDVLIRDMPAELKREIEDRARAHKRSLSREIAALLWRALEQDEPEDEELKGGLGDILARTFSKDHNYDDFALPSRDDFGRAPPAFD